ncbi:hypothetical protein BBK36DRAFT_1158499 [Trichoderma citrinoviride]|uniref:Uncharacterized protein n=1 Tax=Trichoderma citrinoviride TaxID=58853 RepID=A0A2T4BEK3_9HYPO|nr:hypothetical protein BBK36DRAFT_1158499 [Trichoderma citrinoviride]PTB67671.1 hypothetical protein BBK36DRAFT_1158499 [Trichoderma citrinoviride]
MLLLRVLASLLFHLPIVLSLPQQQPNGSPPPPIPTHHHHRYNRSLEIVSLVPPPPPPPTTTTIIEPIPFPLPPTTSFPLPITTSDPWRDMCKPGQECDCTRIKDKNGEEYFQCVTNPRCDHCWINLTTTSTSPSFSFTTFSPTPIVTLATPHATKNLLSSSSNTDYRTLLPGTYTSSSSSAHGTTAHVVQQSASIHFVTLTVTREREVTPLCEAASSSSLGSGKKRGGGEAE